MLHIYVHEQVTKRKKTTEQARCWATGYFSFELPRAIEAAERGQAIADSNGEVGTYFTVVSFAPNAGAKTVHYDTRNT